MHWRGLPRRRQRVWFGDREPSGPSNGWEVRGVGTYTVYICDRCSKRYDDVAGDIMFPPDWAEVTAMTGPR